MNRFTKNLCTSLQIYFENVFEHLFEHFIENMFEKLFGNRLKFFKTLHHTKEDLDAISSSGFLRYHEGRASPCV